MLQTTKSHSPNTAYWLIAAMAVAGGLTHLFSPLRSARPAYRPAALSSAGTGEVAARLWEDPLRAVQRHVNEVRSNGGDAHHRAADGRVLDPSDSPDLLVLPVAIPGGSSLNQHETRLRSRYAVLAALDFAGYRPARRSTLSFLHFGAWPPAVESDRDTAPGPELVVPYEKFEPDPLQPRRRRSKVVLVLWIREDALHDNPYARLEELVAAFVGPERVSRSTVRYLGPTSSDGLERMVGLVSEEGLPCRIRDLRAFSSWATADLASMGFTEADLHRAGIKATIASDVDVIRALLAELELRDIDPTEDKVALISEWDTSYGRTLPRTFAALIHAATLNADPEADSVARRWDLVEPAYKAITDSHAGWPPKLSRAIYLQGLDGRTPFSDSTGAGQNPASSSEQQPDVAALERPEGQSQLDYARRLAVSLRLREGRDLKAIGILGSDVYDKLLLIQALREQFPHALFFTTDLDARLLHPTQIRWTRNLIVASSFGLRVIEEAHAEGGVFHDRQLQLPPFRDGYQSSLHLAALMALGERLDARTFNTPKVYEIGRTDAILLRPREATTGPGGIGGAFRSRSAAIAGTFAVASVALLLFVAWRLLSGEFECTWGRMIGAGTTLVAWTAIAVAALRFADAQEPFALLEGVSIWPTEIIRMVGAGLALYFLARATCRLRDNDQQLTREFHLDTASRSDGGLSPWQALRRMASDVPATLFGQWQETGKKADVRELWAEYLALGEARNRRVRVVIAALVYGVIAGVVFRFLGTPVVPYRGNVAWFADVIALFACVFSFILLIFYVVDVVLLDSWFIKKLSTAPSRWPAQALRACTRSDHGTDAFLRDWLDVNFVAKRTDLVGSLVIAPFLVLALLIVSRLSYFDRWDWPVSLMVVLGTHSIIAIASVLMLRRSAERGRHRALERLGRQRLGCVAADDGTRLRFIDRLIEDIASVRQGAFAPLPQHPVVGAFLLPFGSITAVGILEFLATTV